MNTRNYSIYSGNISKEVVKFENKDGSSKYLITVACQDDYVGKDGKRGTQFIQVEGYCPAGASTAKFDNLVVGERITVQCSTRNNNYTDKNGNPVYRYTFRIETLTFEDSKSKKEAKAGIPTPPSSASAPAEIEIEKPEAEVSEPAKPKRGRKAKQESVLDECNPYEG